MKPKAGKTAPASAPAPSGAIAATFPAELPRTLKPASVSQYGGHARSIAFQWLCGELTDEDAANAMDTTAGSALRSKIATILRDALKHGMIQIEVLS